MKVFIVSMLTISIIILRLFVNISSLESDLEIMRDSRNSAVSTLRSLEDKVEWYEDITEEMFGFKLQPYMVRSTTVTVTSYNPLEEQCDSTPLIACDNELVAPGIVALPQHYRREIGISLGDTVWIPPYGQFIVRDHMNDNKPSGRVDIISFIPEWSKKFGRDSDRTMYWFVKGGGNL